VAGGKAKEKSKEHAHKESAEQTQKRVSKAVAVPAETVAQYKKHHQGVPAIMIPHEEFKVRVGQSLAIIHTGDAVPYSSVILKSG
jgi:D-ribose pyranose/furanose isomerase RbsD